MKLSHPYLFNNMNVFKEMMDAFVYIFQVPGQRTLTLHLIAAVLDKAIGNIWQNQADSASNSVDVQGPVDWEAIWAFALGPEPELALSLR